MKFEITPFTAEPIEEGSECPMPNVKQMEDPQRIYATDSKLSVHDDVQREIPPKSGYQLSANFTVSILPGSPIDRLFKRLEREARMRNRLARWAVTHGYEVRIPAKSSDGKIYTIRLRKPSQVNTVIRIAKFVPPFQAIDREGHIYKIKHSKLKRV